MIKELPPEPLEFTFENDSSDTTEPGTKTYTLPKKVEEPIFDSELSLGEPIQSAPMANSGSELTFTENDDDDELVITGLPVKTTAISSEQSNGSPSVEELVAETTAIMNQIEDSVVSLEHSQSKEPVIANEEEIEATGEVVSTLTPIVEIQKQKEIKKTKSKNSTKTLINTIWIIGILSLIGIIIVINLLLFGDVTSTNDITDLTKVISTSPGNISASPSSSEVKRNPTESSSLIKIGELTSSYFSGEYKFIYNVTTSIGSFQLGATTPRPGPLTPEEVGRKVATPAWLKKIETQKHPVKDLLQGKNQTLSIPTRFYFDTNGVSTRFIGSTEIVFMRDQADNITLDYKFIIPTSAKVALNEENLAGRITFSF